MMTVLDNNITFIVVVVTISIVFGIVVIIADDAVDGALVFIITIIIQIAVWNSWLIQCKTVMNAVPQSQLLRFAKE